MKKLIVLCGIVTAYVCFSFMPGPDLVVTSSAFQHNKDIPRKYSCEGQNISPDLHIGNIPAEAKTLAIIMHDPDAPVDGGFTHWVVWNVSTDGQIPENFLGGKQGLNGAQKAGYTGMCPPTGKHRYNFTIYALDAELDLVDRTDKSALEGAMTGHVLAKGTLTGLYKKRGK